MKKLIIIIFLLFAIFFVGCSQVDLGKVNLSQVSEEDINKVIVCNPPYMRYATECCLDKNNNSLCDRDEELNEENINLISNKDENNIKSNIIQDKIENNIKINPPIILITNINGSSKVNITTTDLNVAYWEISSNGVKYCLGGIPEATNLTYITTHNASCEKTLFEGNIYDIFISAIGGIGFQGKFIARYNVPKLLSTEEIPTVYIQKMEGTKNIVISVINTENKDLIVKDWRIKSSNGTIEYCSGKNEVIKALSITEINSNSCNLTAGDSYWVNLYPLTVEKLTTK